MYEDTPRKAVETGRRSAATQPSRLRLKERRGWFPAGDCVRRARNTLSDGAFKLYISISLDADPNTGRCEGTHQQLATLLRKSKRIIGVYVREIEGKGVCHVRPAANQHARTVFEVCDEYWPYHRVGGGPNQTPDTCQQTAETDDPYVERIRRYFLALGVRPSKATR